MNTVAFTSYTGFDISDAKSFYSIRVRRKER